VFRDRAVVDAVRAGKADATLRQLLARELVSAGADRLDETELRRTVEKSVMPQPGDHQHVGLRHSILQRPGIANREAIDVGLEGRKPLLQLVGDVGEADRELIGGGSMAILRSMTTGLAIGPVSFTRR
jgi:hypothetical protein